MMTLVYMCVRWGSNLMFNIFTIYSFVFVTYNFGIAPKHQHFVTY